MIIFSSRFLPACPIVRFLMSMILTSKYQYGTQIIIVHVFQNSYFFDCYGSMVYAERGGRGAERAGNPLVPHSFLKRSILAPPPLSDRSAVPGKEKICSKVFPFMNAKIGDALPTDMRKTEPLEIGLSIEGRIIGIRLSDYYSNISEMKRLFHAERIVRIIRLFGRNDQ